MGVLLTAHAGVVAGLAGLVRLWGRQPAATLIGGAIGLLLLACVIAFTAELWFELLGFSRGDGQVFIGYFMFGGMAFLAMPAMGLMAAIVIAIRPKELDGQTGTVAGQADVEQQDRTA